jgi:hypothetical protein
MSRFAEALTGAGYLVLALTPGAPESAANG